MNRVDELRAQMREVGEAIRTAKDPGSEEYRSLQAAYMTTDKQLRAEQAKQSDKVRANLQSGRHAYGYESGAAFGAGQEEFAAGRDTAFSTAMRTLESHHPRTLSADAAGAMEGVLRNDTPTAIGARYISAVGDDDYTSAFGKILGDPQTGHLRFTPQEHAA